MTLQTRISTLAATGLALFALSGAANASVCGNILTLQIEADGTSACAGPVDGNIPPYNVNDPTDSPDVGFGFTDWVLLHTDNVDSPDTATPDVIDFNLETGQWRYTGTGGYAELLLVIKAGNSFVTFLVSGDINTWYDFSITPDQQNGLSHMSLLGRNPSTVPEPKTLALLGLGLAGLGLARRRKA